MYTSFVEMYVKVRAKRL